MTTVRLVGKDTIKINDRILADFGHGEIGKLSFSTDIVTVKTGKNGNTIYAKNESGNQATFELKVLRGSEDDKFLNSLMVLQNSDLPKFVLMNGMLTKKFGDGEGETISDSYVLTGGVFTKNLETTSNVEGDVEQAVAHYTMQFAIAPRSIS
jgi:hypothetical protein